MKTVLPAGLVVEIHGGYIRDYIDGKREIREINMGYMEEYRQDRQIKG